MSAPSPSTRHRRHHVLLHHVRQPYGIAIVVGILFILGWGVWTFMVW
jgi:hypothetical protein